MKERSRHIVVVSKSIVLGLITIVLGILIAWNGYKIITTPGILWSCDCCFGSCYCDPTPMKIIGLFWSVLAITCSLVWAYNFIIEGYNYYKHRYFHHNRENIENGGGNE